MGQDEIRKVQLAQLDILKEFKRVCDKNGIKFILAAGTMLGAVRHKGFIPWDDDVDVAMLRSEYDRFKAVCKEDLDPEFEFFDWDNDPGFGSVFGKLRIKGTHYLEESAKNTTAQDGIYIDVFPLDSVAENEEAEKKDEKKMYLWKRAMLAKKGYIPANAGLVKRVVYFGLKYIYPFSSDKVKYKIKALWNERNQKETEYLANHGGAYNYWIERMKREYVLDTIDIEFEHVLMPVPRDYDGFLKHMYGDYMELPPEEKRGNRHGIINIDFGNYSIKSKD